MINIADCRLRLMEEKDLGKVLAWRNDERVRSQMFTDHIISLEEHRTWFEKIKCAENSIYLIFEYKNIPVGLTSYTDIDKKNGVCFSGSYIGETEVLIGAGAVMMFLCLEYIFKIKKMRKVCGEIFSSNKAAINYQKKLGYVQEGYFSKHILKNNVYKDVVRLSIFQDNWLENSSKTEYLIFRDKKVDFNTLRKILPNT